jgi:hypothetical protein
LQGSSSTRQQKQRKKLIRGFLRTSDNFIFDEEAEEGTTHPDATRTARRVLRRAFRRRSSPVSNSKVLSSNALDHEQSVPRGQERRVGQAFPISEKPGQPARPRRTRAAWEAQKFEGLLRDVKSLKPE